MKKTINFFAMLAVAGAMTFVGCDKDDEDAIVTAETLQITFDGRVIPMGWFDATFDGQYAQIEAATAHTSKGSYLDVTLPYAQFQFTQEEIFNGYYIEHANRIYDGICEWAYDPDLPQTFRMSGFDATALTVESAFASLGMYDAYAERVLEADEVAETEMTATATNISFDPTDNAKAKKNYVFHN